MRLTDSFETWLNQVEYFVDSMSAYQADFVLFPEFFNVPLMGIGDQHNQYDAIRFLATYADRIVESVYLSVTIGSVTNSRDRRDELFELRWLGSGMKSEEI
jgi:predicted amidohydrolase